jgi:CRP/FNR family transcriptional regulator
MLPKEKNEWLVLMKLGNHYVLQSYHNRMDELLDAVDTIAFFKNG